MPETITASELAGLLPQRKGLLPDLDRKSPHYRNAEPLASYVQPTFKVRGSVNPRVLLVAAPAAVGKSALAHWLASRTESLLFDLSRAKLGDGFVPGLTSMIYGLDRRYMADQMIRDGSACLILDALDEALMSSEALDNLRAMVSSIRELELIARDGRPAVVLLGRIDSIEYAEMYLEEAAIPFASVEIQYFDEAQSLKFVASELMRLAEEPGQLDPTLTPADVDERLVKGALGAALSHIAEQLSKLVSDGEPGPPWASDATKSFIGYAPVLSAIATKLFDEPDWEGMDHAFNVENVAGSLYLAVAEICSGILEREQHEVAGRLASQFVLSDTDRLDLYSPRDQLELLVGKGSVAARVIVPESIAQTDRESFRSAVATFVDQHAFVRPGSIGEVQVRRRFQNAVFFEYAVAELALAPAPNLLLALLSEVDGYLGFMFGRFAVVEAERRDRPLSAWALGSVLSSLSQSRTASDKHDAALSTDNLDRMVLSVGVDGDDQAGMVSAIVARDTGVSLAGDLSRLSIDLPDSDVGIGPGRTRITAPFSINCRELIVATESPIEIAPGLRAVPGEHARVSINAMRVVDDYAQPIRYQSAETLVVYSDICGFPWSDHKVEGYRPPIPRGAFDGAFKEFRALARWFQNFARTQPDGEKGVDEERFNLAVNKGRIQVSRTTYRTLLENGTLRSQSGKLRLTLPPGVPLLSLIHLDLTSEQRAAIYSVLQER